MLKNYPDLVLALTFQEIAAGEGWGAITLLLFHHSRSRSAMIATTYELQFLDRPPFIS